MDKLQDDHHPAINHLLTWVASTKDRGMRSAGADSGDNVEDSPYISRTSLDEYYSQGQRVESLLGALFKDQDALLETLDIGLIRRRYPKIFCLLITIGKGQFINYFVGNGIDDQHLPLRRHWQTDFPSATWDPHFFSKFYTQQWQFCVPELDYAVNRRFDAKEWILPIQRIRTLGEGASANTYQIEVPRAYDRLQWVGNNRKF